MKILLWSFIALAVLLVGFLSFNTYIYNQKQNPDTTQVFPDGEMLGFIHGLVDDNTALYFDEAVWLSGKAGEDAAITAEFCTEETRDECLPNDYFIQNEIMEDVRIPVRGDIVVRMQTWNMEEVGEVMLQEIDMAEFSNLINDQELHWKNLPYKILLENGFVTRIEEVYIP